MKAPATQQSNRAPHRGHQAPSKSKPGQALLLATAIALAACGGGGGGSSSNGGGSGSTVSAPSITAQPASTAIVPGATGTLTVVATGTSPTYQWFKDSVAIAGATSATLSLTAAGSYYVAVSNSAGSVNSSTVTVTYDTTSFALQSTVGTPNYVGTDDNAVMESATYSRINAARMGAGAGAVNQDSTMDAAARGHSTYRLSNPTESGHTEIAGHADFYGADPLARIKKAGYMGSLFGEGVVEAKLTYAAPFADYCPQVLLNSMYHLASLMGPYRDLGVGYKTDASGAGFCVLDYAYKTTPQYAASGSVVAYPYDGQIGVEPVFAPAQESPRPPATLTGQVGQPIFVSMASMAVVTGDGSGKGSVDSFVLKDAGGNIVPAYVIASPSITVAAGVETLDDSANAVFYQPYTVFLVPKAPLAFGAKYTVTFTGKFNGVPHSKSSWAFTTRS